MWSVKDMFYGEAEPVWIMKPEKEDKMKAAIRGDWGGSTGDSGKKEAARAADDSIRSSMAYNPYYYPDYAPPPAPKRVESKAAATDQRKDSSIPYYPYYYPDYAPRPPASKREESKAAFADQKKDSSLPYYPSYYPEFVPPPAAPKIVESKAATADQKDTKVVLKVPICCGECVELIEAALYRIKGMKSVECDTRKEQVTVIATPAVAPADILIGCRKVFKKSRFWTDADY